MEKRRTESEISGLKAQEAKDYCVELLRELDARSKDPISPGEVQLQELQFELKLREAEWHDNRERQEHERRLKQLELDIERERARQSEATKLADEVRQQQTQMIQRVAESQEKLSIELDRATREHNVKLQMMEAEFEEKSRQLKDEIEVLQQQRDGLVSEISTLAELQANAEEIAKLRNELGERSDRAKKDLKEQDDKIEAAEFEKQKELTRIRREHDLGIAELEAEHKKMLLAANTETVDQLLQEMGAKRVATDELAELRRQASQHQRQSEEELAEIRQDAIDDFRKQLNIMTDSEEPIDVTELYYNQKAAQEDNVHLEKQVAKLESEISRMRTHIEQESTRVAKAIEAARTNIQNNIEPGVKR